MNTVEIGKIGEDAAVKLLKKLGFKILERNLHISHKEIDIIAKNKDYIIFVEVKTRGTDIELHSDYGTPASAVDRHKIKRTLDAARSYLYTSRYSTLQPRFDVVEVYLDKDSFKIMEINHIENAFGA